MVSQGKLTQLYVLVVTKVFKQNMSYNGFSYNVHPTICLGVVQSYKILQNSLTFTKENIGFSWSHANILRVNNHFSIYKQ